MVEQSGYGRPGAGRKGSRIRVPIEQKARVLAGVEMM